MTIILSTIVAWVILDTIVFGFIWIAKRLFRDSAKKTEETDTINWLQFYGDQE